MAPPARTITVALDMSITFYKINIYTLIRKLLQTDSRHNHWVHRKLHQGTQSLHILITLIQNWHSTKWRPFTNTIQHLHCRHNTAKITSLGHGMRKNHHQHIYTLKHECSQDIHTTIPTSLLMWFLDNHMVHYWPSLIFTPY